jgi:hypothetical protein
VQVSERLLDTAPFVSLGEYVEGCLTRIATDPLLNVTGGRLDGADVRHRAALIEGQGIASSSSRLSVVSTAVYPGAFTVGVAGEQPMVATSLTGKGCRQSGSQRGARFKAG